MRRYYILLLGLLFALSFVWSLDYVKPDRSDEYFLSLVPNTIYTASFLAKSEGLEIESVTLNCSARCENLRKNGPYYMYDITAPSEGVYEVSVNYFENGRERVDTRYLYSSYDFLKYELLTQSEHYYLENSNLKLVIENKSDSDVELYFESNLPKYSFPEQSARIHGQETYVKDLNLLPLSKGYYDFELMIIQNGYLVNSIKDSIYSKYDLVDTMSSGVNSYPVLSSSLNPYLMLKVLFAVFK